jgi:hypothetical protein
MSRPTSRQISHHIVQEVVAEFPRDPLPYLMLRTGATEAQCIIALRRDTRRHFIEYDPETGLHKLGPRYA